MSMGNLRSKILETYDSDSVESIMSKTFTPVEEFKFHDLFEDSNNGLFLNGVYFPEEILIKILSYVPPKQLLRYSLVCKKWCNIIKSESLWMDIYNIEFPHKAKRLPWYVYYLYFSTKSFTNLLKNGNGEEKFCHWTLVKNYGDQFKIENPPIGTLPLPEGISDFNGYTSCFVTSYSECNKLQTINLSNKRLLRYIINKFKPSIYVSEWVNGRHDCGSKYKLKIKGLASHQIMLYIPRDEDDDDKDNHLFQLEKTICMEAITDREWQKVEMILEECPKNIMVLVFEHEGVDTQYWKGHYGSKMAGGVVKLLLDSIKPEELVTH